MISKYFLQNVDFFPHNFTNLFLQRINFFLTSSSSFIYFFAEMLFFFSLFRLYSCEITTFFSQFYQ